MAQPAALDLPALRARFLGRSGEPAQGAEGRGLGFFEAALEGLPVPTAILKDGVHLWTNRAYDGLLAPVGLATPRGRSLEAFLESGSWETWRAASAPGCPRRDHLTVVLKNAPEPARELELTLRAFHQGATEYQVISARDLQSTRQAEAAFRRNEHWWRHFFEASIVGVAVLSPERRILDANTALLELVGQSREEVLDRSWTEWMEATEAEAEVQRREAGPTLLKADLTLRREDGLQVPVRVSSHPIYAPDGSVQCFLALVQDLTELHAHQAREALLLQAIEQGAAMVVITRGDGCIEYVNEAFTRTTGYRREEVLNRNPRILKSGVQTPEFYRQLWETITRGEVWTGRLCNRRKDGATYWEQATISPVFEGGRLTHYLAVKEDITGQLDLQADHARLASAIAQAREGIFLATPRGRLLYGNEALRNLLPAGHPALEPGGWLLRGLPAGARRETLRAMRQALAAGRAWEGRIRLAGGFSGDRILGGTLTLAQDTDGRGSCVVGVFQDLTRELEEERNLLQVEKLNSLGALAGGVVHDLNNVLSAILTASELLEWSLPEEDAAHAKLQVIRQAVLRAREINRRIQTFSRKEHERFVPFDLSALVREVCALLKATLPSSIRLVTAIGTSLWTDGIPSQLHQVLMNLAVNSYQALGDREGTLEIALREIHGEEDGLPGTQPQLMLTVSDDGPGIPPEILSHIFEPYFTTKAASGGTGLGLSVVQKILTAHGGSIRVDSRPGEGTTMCILLPMAQAPAQEHPAPPDLELSGLENLLLVGEDEVQLALMKQGLARLGYHVTAFADGMLALDSVKQNPGAFDVVVIEPEPRGLKGSALLGKLRALRQTLALIQISDRTLGPSETPDPGAADAFLTRPVGLQDLARAIREVAPRLKAPEGNLDPESVQASRNLCVLLAEDSSITRTLVRNWLRKLGCEVLEARDGELAWDLYAEQRERVDFVFTDLLMPRMDGFQLIERIRTVDPRIPVVVLTSLEDHGSAKAALNLGVDELLNKPFSQQKLVECVDRLVAKLQDQRRNRESHDTAEEVRRAQEALVARPEADVPIFTVHQSHTDAGGDLFKWFRRPDGSLFFVLGDVMGHSVMSSYAVAAFLGMLPGPAHEARDLMDLVARLNRGVLEGPFPDIPICALLGHWDLKTGRVHLVNAGVPHGCLSDREGERAFSIPINGTPLGFFEHPLVEEKVLWLREGDRLLFSTDGVMEAASADGTAFDQKAVAVWSSLGGTPIRQSLEIFCAAAQLHAARGIRDDVMVVAFEQGPTSVPGTVCWMPGELAAVDGAIRTLEGLLDRHPRSIPLTSGDRFDILTAAREALINAVSHGNGPYPQGRICFQARWMEDPPRLQLVVADEGTGFEAPADRSMPDPCAERGRGLPFIYHHATTAAMAGGELTLTFAWEP